MKTINRSSFIRLLLFFSASFFTELANAETRLLGLADSPRSLSDKLVRAFFRNPLSAKMVGDKYLQSKDGKLSEEDIIDSICFFSSRRHSHLLNTNSKALKKLLNQQIRDDFSLGRIVKLDNWILSETEVNLCAIAAMPRSKKRLKTCAENTNF